MFKGRIIVDTGSGVHIVGRPNAHKKRHSMIRTDGRPLKLNTANGQINSTSCVSIGSASFKLPIEACVLEHSPNVLSVGKLCNEGWSLNWNAHQTPTLTSPNGHLKVTCFVPYLDECDQLLISHHVEVNSKNKTRFQALPTVEESGESPEAIPFSPVGLEAGQDTPEPTDEVRIQSLSEKTLSRIQLVIHIPKPVLSGVSMCKIER